ncbi:CorA family divalent cation transporter [Agromyces cerinus subsp. nitratus]
MSGTDPAPMPFATVTFTDDGVAQPEAEDPPGENRVWKWLHASNPDQEDAAAMARELGLHPVVAEDLMQGRQPPKLEAFDEQLYLTVWDDVLNEDEPDVRGELFLIIGDRWLLTVQRGAHPTMPDLERILTAAGPVPATSPIAATYRILNSIVQAYVGTAAQIEAELDELETQVFDSNTQEDFVRIYSLRRRIGRIDRAIGGLASALEGGRDHLARLVGEDQTLAPYLRHLYNDTTGVATLAAAQHAALDAAVANHQSNVGYRQNKNMRTISAFAALLAIPTLIAGVYGMNFKNLPLVQWQFGWVVIVATTVVLDLVVYRTFKRRGWL